MKKVNLYKYIGLSALCLALSGCADFVDNAPDDILTMEMVFNDKTRTEDWLQGVYNGIPDPYWGLTRDIGWEILAKDMTPSQGWAPWWGGTPLQWRIGQWFTNSSWNGSYWTLSQRIRSAFLFINNVHPLPSQGVTEAQVETMKDECRFLIAYYYWLMTETYGAVPFYDQALDPNAPLSETQVGQPTFEFMVDWCNEQFTQLSKTLPAKWENTYVGRATSIAALALRARMLLFAASPLVNGNTWYANYKNNDGQLRFNPTYDESKWKRAADAFKELIDAAEAAGHGLYYKYNADGSLDPFMSCYGATMQKVNEGNVEVLWLRSGNCNYGEYEQHATPHGKNGNGGFGVTQDLVDAFYMANGKAPVLGYNSDGSPIINPESGYREDGFSTEAEYRKTSWYLMSGFPDAELKSEGKWMITQPNTYLMYCNREPRFYLTVCWNGQWFKTHTANTDFMYNHPDGGPGHDAPQNGYLNRKRISLDYEPRTGVHPYRPGILFRMAEAYLSYAEALNEYDPGNKAILENLNKIRYRAGIPEFGTGVDGNGFQRLPAPTSQSEMRELIHKERRLELCTEGIRYNDLRRWLQADKDLNGPDYGMNFYGTEYSCDPNNQNAFFKRTKYLDRVYVRRNYWMPIHQGQVDTDPTLVQAPFWDEE